MSSISPETQAKADAVRELVDESVPRLSGGRLAAHVQVVRGNRIVVRVQRTIEPPRTGGEGGESQPS